VSDIREREFWSDYQSAYQDAFNHTSTDYAPWIVVPADYKWSARVTVAHLIVEALERMKPRYPSLSVAGEAQLKKARKLLNQE
jgi:polyphosphate kinase 2 (PPK2 family)